MSLVAIGCIAVAVTLVLIFLRVPLAFVFALVGFGGLWYIKGIAPAYHAIASVPYQTMTSYTWTVVPMFVMMGYFADHSGVVAEIYEGVRKWVGNYRGGLSHAIFLGNAAYGAVCGAPIAAALTFTVTCLKQMRKYNYSDGLTLGSIAAGSLLSGLIPPSMPFIIFGGLTETSVGKLFLAGIFPGLILTGLFMAVAYFQCVLNPKLAPPSEKTPWKEKIKGTPGMWITLFVFIILIGGLYLGIFTPSEGGACAAALILILGLLRRKLGWKGFTASILETVLTTGVLFVILIGVNLFNLLVVMTGLTNAVADLLLSISSSPTVSLLIVAFVYLLLGTFMDQVGLMLVTVPILFPALIAIGADAMTIGVVTVLACTTGTITPPYGMIVFAISGAVKDVPMYSIFRGVYPFLIAIVACIILVIFVPSINSWLPGMMMGR
jgi:tripartite ATP-independent transporter DctM subunit